MRSRVKLSLTQTINSQDSHTKKGQKNLTLNINDVKVNKLNLITIKQSLNISRWFSAYCVNMTDCTDK